MSRQAALSPPTHRLIALGYTPRPTPLPRGVSPLPLHPPSPLRFSPPYPRITTHTRAPSPRWWQWRGNVPSPRSLHAQPVVPISVCNRPAATPAATCIAVIACAAALPAKLCTVASTLPPPLCSMNGAGPQWLFRVLWTPHFLWNPLDEPLDDGFRHNIFRRGFGRPLARFLYTVVQ